jgi:lysophospholipase L1-like esterase
LPIFVGRDGYWNGRGLWTPQLTSSGQVVSIRRDPPSPAASQFFNFSQTNTQLLRDAIDGANGGTSRDRVLWIGDSTLWGAWSDGVDSTGLRADSTAVHLAGLLNSNICPAVLDSWVGCGDKTTNAQMKKWSPFFTGSTSWNPGAAAAYAIGGQMFNCTTNAVALGWNKGVNYDTIEVLCANPAAGGNFDIGTATTGVLQNVARDAGLATNVPRLITVNVGSTVSGAVQLTNKSTTAVNIMAVNVYLSTEFKLAMYSAGIPGARSNDWVADPATFPFAARAGIGTLDPKFVFIELSINDARLGTSIATYKTNLQILIDLIEAGGGGVCLVVGNQRYTGTDTDINGGTETSAALQLTYEEALEELATLNDIPLINMRTLLGDWAALDALGYMAIETGGFKSPSHLTSSGNLAKAGVYEDFFAEVAAL